MHRPFAAGPAGSGDAPPFLSTVCACWRESQAAYERGSAASPGGGGVARGRRSSPGPPRRPGVPAGTGVGRCKGSRRPGAAGSLASHRGEVSAGGRRGGVLGEAGGGGAARRGWAGRTAPLRTRERKWKCAAAPGLAPPCGRLPGSGGEAARRRLLPRPRPPRGECRPRGGVRRGALQALAAEGMPRGSPGAGSGLVRRDVLRRGLAVSGRRGVGRVGCVCAVYALPPPRPVFSVCPCPGPAAPQPGVSPGEGCPGRGGSCPCCGRGGRERGRSSGSLRCLAQSAPLVCRGEKTNLGSVRFALFLKSAPLWACYCASQVPRLGGEADASLPPHWCKSVLTGNWMGIF